MIDSQKGRNTGKLKVKEAQIQIVTLGPSVFALWKKKHKTNATRKRGKTQKGTM